MKDFYALSSGIDKEKNAEIIGRVEQLTTDVQSVVSQLVDEVCKDLDDCMAKFDTLLADHAREVSDKELEDIILNIPSLLYFVVEGQEILGIKEDVSKSIRNEIRNKIREKSTGTVADKDAAADLHSQQETIVNIIYARAYKKVKLRVEAAWEMLNSAKKVLSLRKENYNE